MSRVIGDEIIIGGKLAELRKGKGLSQTEAAHDLGVSRGTISRIESGDLNVSFTTLLGMAKMYGAKQVMNAIFPDGRKRHEQDAQPPQSEEPSFG